MRTGICSQVLLLGACGKDPWGNWSLEQFLFITISSTWGYCETPESAAWAPPTIEPDCSSHDSQYLRVCLGAGSRSATLIDFKKAQPMCAAATAHAWPEASGQGSGGTVPTPHTMRWGLDRLRGPKLGAYLRGLWELGLGSCRQGWLPRMVWIGSRSAQNPSSSRVLPLR